MRILENEIYRVIPHRSLEEILTKIERAHRPKENRYSLRKEQQYSLRLSNVFSSSH